VASKSISNRICIWPSICKNKKERSKTRFQQKVYPPPFFIPSCICPPLSCIFAGRTSARKTPSRAIPPGTRAAVELARRRATLGIPPPSSCPTTALPWGPAADPPSSSCRPRRPLSSRRRQAGPPLCYTRDPAAAPRSSSRRRPSLGFPPPPWSRSLPAA